MQDQNIQNINTSFSLVSKGSRKKGVKFKEMPSAEQQQQKQ